MPKAQPWFKWYPADAETDTAYRSLSLAARGLFHAALNYSWINNGLPDDNAKLQRALGCSPSEFRWHWPMIAGMFPIYPDGLRRNKRQEAERCLCVERSVKASESVRVRYERKEIVGDSYGDTRARASVSVSVSSSGSIPERIVFPKKNAPRIISHPGFDAFWERYPRKQGRDDAGRIWISLDCEAATGAVLSCLDRYLTSGDVARGAIANPARWLQDQARDKWAGTWPENGSGSNLEKRLKEEGLYES